MITGLTVVLRVAPADPLLLLPLLLPLSVVMDIIDTSVQSVKGRLISPRNDPADYAKCSAFGLRYQTS